MESSPGFPVDSQPGLICISNPQFNPLAYCFLNSARYGPALPAAQAHWLLHHSQCLNMFGLLQQKYHKLGGFKQQTFTSHSYGG